MHARDLDIVLGEPTPAPLNAITDVPGVMVGHTTLVSGQGPLRIGRGPARTGVTVVLPHAAIRNDPVFGGCHTLNGSGDVSGFEGLGC